MQVPKDNRSQFAMIVYYSFTEQTPLLRGAVSRSLFEAEGANPRAGVVFEIVRGALFVLEADGVAEGHRMSVLAILRLS